MMSITGLALLIAAVGILIMVMVILMEPRRQATLRPGDVVYMDANGRYVPYQGGGAPATIGIMTAVLDDERAMVRIRQ